MMNKKYIILLFILLFFSLNTVVAASDANADFNNSTSKDASEIINTNELNDRHIELNQDNIEIISNGTDDSGDNGTDNPQGNGTDDSGDNGTDTPDNGTDNPKKESKNKKKNKNKKKIVKVASKISLKSNRIKSKDKLVIYLKDSKGKPLKYKKITAKINKKKHYLKTNKRGAALLNVHLPAKKYKMTVSYKGDKYHKKSVKTFKVNVSKIKTKLKSKSIFVIRGKYVYAFLTDVKHNPVSGKRVLFKINGKTYRKFTNKKGRVAFRLKFSPDYYKSKLIFKGDKYYKRSHKNLNFYLVKRSSLKIGNDKLLTNGYLRIYLKDLPKRLLSKKTIQITVGNKNFTKRTDKEGIIIFKPKVGVKKYTVTAQFKKLKVSKKVKGVKGSGLDMLGNRVPSKNGMPDVDYLSGSYVMGDGNANYTITKNQYSKVIRRDGECLYYYKKLTKYSYFTTKDNPNINHILPREKWNVIEKEVNRKIVDANTHKYLPSQVSVCLKGKSYVYPEIRDPQNTEYTCGPTSASVCSQVLKNYRCEKYFAGQMGTNQYGTGSSGIAYGLEKNGFSCSYFFRPSFNHALNELKKGACALIFHTKNHYVAIIDISKDGSKVLVSNSYGDWYNIPTNWVSVKFMKTRFYKNYDDSLIVKKNYHLSDRTKHYLHNYYYNLGPNWDRCNVHESI